MNSLLMAPAQQGGNPLMQLLPILLIGLVFYFFMIRPQTKRAKDQRKFMEEVKKGDKVVSVGGIHGKIVEVADTYFMVEIDTNVKVKMDKSSISLEASKLANKA